MLAKISGVLAFPFLSTPSLGAKDAVVVLEGARNLSELNN